MSKKGLSKMKVFLGGTCGSSTWREEMMPKLCMDYFNPVVSNWTLECIEEEERQKNHECNVHLYVITSEMMGFYSIAELMDSCFKTVLRKSLYPSLVYFTFLKEGFSDAQIRSLEAIAAKVSGEYKCFVCRSLEETIKSLNNWAMPANLVLDSDED